MRTRTKRILVVLGTVFVLGAAGTGWLYHHFFSSAAAVRVALAGRSPSGLRELRVQEDAWTNDVIRAYFRCDPASLRRILEQAPFERADIQPREFSFGQTPFADLQGYSEVQQVVAFRRADLGAAKGHCHVYTDASFGFAYLEYSVD